MNQNENIKNREKFLFNTIKKKFSYHLLMLLIFILGVNLYFIFVGVSSKYIVPLLMVSIYFFVLKLAIDYDKEIFANILSTFPYSWVIADLVILLFLIYLVLDNNSTVEIPLISLFFFFDILFVILFYSNYKKEIKEIKELIKDKEVIKND